MTGTLFTASAHFVTQIHHAAFIGFDLRQMQTDVPVEILEERYALTDQYRQDRITDFVGQATTQAIARDPVPVRPDPSIASERAGSDRATKKSRPGSP